MQSLKSRIQSGDTTHGCLLSFCDPSVTELMGQAGFDWMIIDQEHGLSNDHLLLTQLMALKQSITVPLVRVENTHAARIAHVMDAGAMGVMVPRINNATEAKDVVNGLHYPPIGKRGVAGLTRASDYGNHYKDYVQNISQNAICILQIESKDSLDHLDAIANTEHVDVLFIGPADLSMDLGIFGQYDHLQYMKAVENTIKAASKAGKAVGILVFSDKDYQKYWEMGIRFMGYSTDLLLLKESSINLVKRMDTLRDNLKKNY